MDAETYRGGGRERLAVGSVGGGHIGQVLDHLLRVLCLPGARLASEKKQQSGQERLVKEGGSLDPIFFPTKKGKKGKKRGGGGEKHYEFNEGDEALVIVILLLLLLLF